MQPNSNYNNNNNNSSSRNSSNINSNSSNINITNVSFTFKFNNKNNNSRIVDKIDSNLTNDDTKSEQNFERLRFSTLTTTIRTTEFDSGARFRTERAKSDWENDEDKRTSTEVTATGNDDYTYRDDSDDDDEDDDDGVEQMQLDPGIDFYDDEDDNDEEAETDYTYDGAAVENAALRSDKILDLHVEETTTTTTKRNNERRHVLDAQTEEEIDMGYDEDDERIAAERPKIVAEPAEKGYMNEEGSGGAFTSRFRPNYMTFKNNNNNNKKGRNMYKGGGGGHEEVGAREGSGNFANDDEDNDNDDDDDDDDDDDGVVDEDNGKQVGGGGSDSFFASKRKTSYFRKNTNDAIKIISTPLGKVGIVYQQTGNEDETLGGGGAKKTENADKTKPTTALTDFDALSPDPDSSRLASSHPKITPVLTADGKVALLYRGDSENTKYEPIRNLTHKLTNSKDDTDNNDSYATTTTNKKQQQFAKDSGSSSSGSDEQTDFNESSDFELTKLGQDKSHNDYDKEAAAYTPVFVPPTSGSFIIRSTDSVLPMINRPLSEVLGIKKNQFKQFRVKDIATMQQQSSSSSTDVIPRGVSLAEQTSASSSSTSLHFLTKVNLAEYPTSLKGGPNRDFDFSQDNTMLDERSRHREQINNEVINGAGGTGTKTTDSNSNSQQGQQQWSVDNNAATFANEEMLSKTEVVDLAIIPQLDNDEFGRFNKHEVEARRHHRNRQLHRHRQKEEDLSGIHCVMQIFMGIAAISTVFGMLGTFFKQRILDQLRLMHW